MARPLDPYEWSLSKDGFRQALNADAKNAVVRLYVRALYTATPFSVSWRLFVFLSPVAFVTFPPISGLSVPVFLGIFAIVIVAAIIYQYWANSFPVIGDVTETLEITQGWVEFLEDTPGGETRSIAERHKNAALIEQNEDFLQMRLGLITVEFGASLTSEEQVRVYADIQDYLKIARAASAD